MIVHDFYVISIPIRPFKADIPLFVDPDAVLPCPVAAEHLQSVGWRDAEVAQRDGIVEHAQLAVADLLDVLGQPGRAQAFEDAGGFLALEGFGHVFKQIT
jgi:hypothetical protein